MTSDLRTGATDADVATDTDVATDVVDALDAAVCSDGAPSARNLIVTVFGDLVLPNEDAIGEVSVQDLTALLAPFGVNERLVRTSLSRVVAEGLVTSRTEGRRSHYSVAAPARATFDRADRRIYGGPAGEWDGEWTIVVIDGNSSTTAGRAEIRRRLGWAGFGSIGPNLMASPLVDAAGAADVVGDAEPGSVMIARSRILDGDGLLGTDQLVRRSVDLEAAELAHGNLLEAFAAFDEGVLATLDDDRCLKLRLLLVARFRRVALAEPSVPPSLLPSDWVGHRSRQLAARVYEAVVERSDRAAGRIVGADCSTPAQRFSRSSV